MDFVGGGGGGNGGLGSENGPILYSEPNRTSAIDDIRSVVIYIFIITIFLCFFLILPGIRNEKFPTFICITTSLIVTSIILIALFGTTWHVGEAQILAAYKAFSRDKIQGELSVRIGLQSVNITLKAQKYYIHHATDGPIIMDNSPIISSGPLSETVAAAAAVASSISGSGQQSGIDGSSAAASSFINQEHSTGSSQSASNLAEELLGGRTSDGASVDTELEVDEVFATSSSSSRNKEPSLRKIRSSSTPSTSFSNTTIHKRLGGVSQSTPARATGKQRNHLSIMANGQSYTIKRVADIDINYNERFYWIGPSQMRQEHHNALERGLPYPILTVVEYLSQDEAGFSWSRQYRAAGYYSHIMLWLSLCVCALMFFLHCAAPKYGIYTMQLLGCLLLFTNFTYATLVPRGEQKLVIPFEGQSLYFKFGWNFWLVMIGGCLSLIVGTLIVIIDSLFPNFIFTTILDKDFDVKYYRNRTKQKTNADGSNGNPLERPVKPPFFNDSSTTSKQALASSSSNSDSHFHSKSSTVTTTLNDKALGEAQPTDGGRVVVSKGNKQQQLVSRHHRMVKVTSSDNTGNGVEDVGAGGGSGSGEKKSSSHLSELFVGPLTRRSPASGDVFSPTSDSEIKQTQKNSSKQDSSVVEMLGGDEQTSDTYLHQRHNRQSVKSRHYHHQ